MAQRYAPYSYELTDQPYFGYEIHVAKTSFGWLPLFQGHKDGINSVAEYKAAHDTGEFKIYDEYGTEYNWDAFDDRVIKFNGGILGVKKPKKIKQDKNSPFHDECLPEYMPISHVSGSNQSYKYSFIHTYDENFVDLDGFEFCTRDFG